MAQLGDNTFAFDGRSMSIEQAAAIVAEQVRPVTETEVLPVAEADGRVLAEDVTAGRNLPPFANSAVDGYAVRFSDLNSPSESRLMLGGRVSAGDDAAGISAGGCAVRVFTGAPLPSGADTVYMQEDVSEDGGFVRLPGGLRCGANVRMAGEDIACGETALSAGRRMRPQDLSLLAGLGMPSNRVLRRPRVAIFSTGDELTEPGDRLPPAGIYDANRAGLRALVNRAGAEVVDLGILRDEPETLSRRLAEAAGVCDLVLTSGGVSVGEEDHVNDAVASVGSLVLWRICIKPGRSVAMGVVAGVPFIGLPGNPVAAFVSFVFVARAAIARLSGATYVPPTSLPVRLGFPYRKKAGRREYLRVSLVPSAEGIMIASKHSQDGAAVMTSLTRTDGLIELADDVTEFEPGAVVPFFHYGSLTS